MSISNGKLFVLLFIVMPFVLTARSIDTLSYAEFCKTVSRIVEETKGSVSFLNETVVSPAHDITITPPEPWVLDRYENGFYEFSIPGSFITAYVDARDFTANNGMSNTSQIARLYSHSYLLRYEHDARNYFQSYIELTSSYMVDSLITIKGHDLPWGSGGIMLLIDAGMLIVNPIHYRYLGGTSHVTAIYAEIGCFKRHEEDMYNLLRSITFYQHNPVHAIAESEQIVGNEIEVLDTELRLLLKKEEQVVVELFDLQGKSLGELFAGKGAGEIRLLMPKYMSSGFKCIRISGENDRSYKIFVK